MLALVGLSTLSPAVASAAPMPITGWAWSAGTDTVSGQSYPFMGWIQMHNVFEDTDTGALSGYAWSSNLGWVSFNAEHVAGCPSGECAPRVDFNTQTVRGWARACSAFANKNSCSGALDPNSGGWDGFISLSGAAGGATYGIKQNPDCSWEGFGWGSTAIGAISFDGVTGVAGNAACKLLSDDPNLTASTVDQSAARVDVPVTLSATISNKGVKSTGRDFPNLFQINPGKVPASLAETLVKRNSVSATLAGESEVPTSITYTFPSVGTWYVRVCADDSNIGLHVITESDEDDNCGNEWKAISVTVDGPVDPEDPDGPGEPGGCSTVGNSCTAVNSCGMPTPGRVNSSCVCTPIDPVCTGGPGGSGAPEVEIGADPLRVPEGETTKVTWRAINVVSCTIETTVPARPVPDLLDAPRRFVGGEGVVLEGERNPIITVQSVFRISCTGLDGSTVDDQVIVNVLPDFNEF